MNKAFSSCIYPHFYYISRIYLISEETGGMAADQLAGAVGGAFVVILWGVIVIILICFIYR